MPINWEEAEKFDKFKPYADDGKYIVKCNGVEIKEVGTKGSVIMKFKFDEGDVAYPTVDHWMSFNNTNWRGYHNQRLLEMFGLTKEQARKSVDLCEKTDDKETIMKAYQQIFDKLLAKKPEVEIEVYTEAGQNGNDYARADFTSPTVRMRNDKSEDKQQPAGDVLPTEMEVASDINLDEVPF